MFSPRLGRQLQRQLSNLLELTPAALQNQKSPEVQTDLLANCGDGFPPPDMSRNQEATADQGPHEVETDRRQQWCAAVGKTRKRKQVCNVQTGFSYAIHTKQFPSPLDGSSTVSCFGNHSKSHSTTVEIIGSLESGRLGERLSLLGLEEIQDEHDRKFQILRKKKERKRIKLHS